MSAMATIPNSYASDRSSASDQIDFEDNNTAADQDDLMDNDSISLSTNKSGFSLSSSVCRMIDERVPTLPPMLPLDPVPNPVDTETLVDIDETDLDNLRRYIQKQCFEGSKWCHPLMFKGSLDRQNYNVIDITQFVGNSKYKDKEGQNSYRIYLDPKDYSVNEELQSMSSIPVDATNEFRVRQMFKSESYVKLSKDLREACGTCGFNIVQNGNQKFDLKKSGLII